MMDFWALIAQATQPAGQPKPLGGGDSFMRIFVPIILMVGVFYWIMIRGQRKDRRRHTDMLSAISTTSGRLPAMTWVAGPPNAQTRPIVNSGASANSELAIAARCHVFGMKIE